MGRVGVVIPAAGGGTRMGGKPKQFRMLGDSPLICQTIRAFEQHEKVHDIVVVAPSEALKMTNEMILGFSKVAAVVSGGATRQDSVARGLSMISSDATVVLVHDAARPFIRAKEITGVIKTAARHGAAALAVPIADTVRYAENDAFTREISRRNLFAVQTPQGFTRQVLTEAYQLRTDDSTATDEVALVRKLGRTVRLVPGRQMNFKITSAEDWARAERLWPAFNRRHYQNQ